MSRAQELSAHRVREGHLASVQDDGEEYPYRPFGEPAKENAIDDDDSTNESRMETDEDRPNPCRKARAISPDPFASTLTKRRKPIKRNEGSKTEEHHLLHHRKSRTTALPGIASKFMGIMKPWINFLMAFTRVMAMLVMVVGVGLAYTVLGQDWSQGLAESHIQAEKFPSACPPNWRFYPTYQSVLSLPPPLYAGGNGTHPLLPPRTLIEKAYRKALRCWHMDKRNSFRHLSDAQWKEIQLLINDSYEKLTAGRGVFPRYTDGYEDLVNTTWWQTEVKVKTLELYKRPEDCRCTWERAVAHSMEQRRIKLDQKAGIAPSDQTAATVSSDVSVSQYCPCTLPLLLQTYQFFLKKNLPPLGTYHTHSFYKWENISPLFHPRPTLLTDPFSTLLRFVSSKYRFLWPFNYSCAMKKALVTQEWFSFIDFADDMEPGGCLGKEWEEKERLREEKREEELYAQEFREEAKYQERMAEIDRKFEEAVARERERMKWLGWLPGMH